MQVQKGSSADTTCRVSWWQNMDISTELKLDASLEVLDVRFEGVLDNQMLSTDGRHTGESRDCRWRAGHHTGSAAAGGGTALYVHDVGQGLLTRRDGGADEARNTL